MSAFDEAYYNGLAVDIAGQPIGRAFHNGDFAGRAPRADDPPTYESQASFLNRHGLFLEGERARLQPAAFDPERIVISEDTPVDPMAEFPNAFDNGIFDETADEGTVC